MVCTQITNMEVKSKKLKNIRQEFEIIMNDDEGRGSILIKQKIQRI